jgi:hypothetical protein
MATANQRINVTMKLFGMPYQFPESVDPRVPTVSSDIGLKFAENIVLEAPILTLIPGKPIYLPGNNQNKKRNTAIAFIEAVSGDFKDSFQSLMDNNELSNLKIYDFAKDYATYIKYVNILCRTGASMLDITEHITVDGTEYAFTRFSWDKYKWSNAYINAGNIKSKISSYFNGGNGDTFTTSRRIAFDDTSENYSGENPPSNIESDEWRTGHFVQFYIDPDLSPSDDFSNATGASSLKSLFEQGESAMKDIAFMANSGGVQEISESVGDFTDQVSAGVSQILSGGNSNLSGMLGRIVNLSGDVVKGNNIVIPDIYQSSSYSKNYNVTIHLKSPYGTRFGYYMDIFVPMMHLLALSLPKMESPNSYSSPFLVKGGVNGMFNVNLGMITGITISKATDTLTVDGLPTEVDVSLSITDLYSDMSMTPSSNPLQFMNNASLLEYLGTACGMSLTSPNLNTKLEVLGSGIQNRFSFESFYSNIKNQAVDKIENILNPLLFLQR